MARASAQGRIHYSRLLKTNSHKSTCRSGAAQVPERGIFDLKSALGLDECRQQVEGQENQRDHHRKRDVIPLYSLKVASLQMIPRILVGGRVVVAWGLTRVASRRRGRGILHTVPCPRLAMHAPPPVHARERGGREAGSSTARGDSRGPSPSGTRATPATPWPPV